MTTLKNFLKNFLDNESGATAIEYGLIAGAIALAIIPALSLIGPSIQADFDAIATQLGSM